MNRREAIKNGLACLIPTLTTPKQTPHTQPPEPIKGVGIFYYPPGGLIDDHGNATDNQRIAREIAEKVCQGSILTLPVEHDGTRLWDFRIEGGDMKQVTVKRSDDA